MSDDQDDLTKLKHAVWGQDGSNGLTQKQRQMQGMLDNHIKECRESRNENRRWLMTILSAIIVGFILMLVGR